jgi:PAS domain-containing protein
MIQTKPRMEGIGHAFLGQGEQWDFRTALCAADGVTRTVAWNTAHVVGRSAAAARVFLLGLDITAQVLAEDEMRIASIAFESQEGMTVTDAKGTILRVNKAFTEITGYTAEEVIGRNPSLAVRIPTSTLRCGQNFCAMGSGRARSGTGASRAKFTPSG